MLVINGLTVAYDQHVAVDGLDLVAADGEVVCVLGPSGCGKSTLLRAIAGLEPVVGGTISVGGDDLAGLRPDERRVGLMFQHHALFPHKSVAQNVGFGPRMQGIGGAVLDERIDEALELVDLAGFGHREVATLSGGEQQRVALARAIAPRPRLLMLDEPLGSLDRRLRDHLVDELQRVFATLGTTVLYVTHDQDEALALADRVAVMHEGRFLRVDTPDRVWRDPRDEFVARFVGHGHLLDGVVVDGTATTALGAFPVHGRPDGPVRLVLLPEALHLADAHTGTHRDAALNLVDATVVARRFAGDHLLARVRTPDGTELQVPVVSGNAPRPGTAVRVAVDPSAARVVTPRGDA